MTYHWFCNTMGATRGAETAYSSRTNEFTSDLSFYCLLSVLWILVCLFVHLAVVCLSIYAFLLPLRNAIWIIVVTQLYAICAIIFSSKQPRYA